MRNGKKESRLQRCISKMVTEIPSSIKQLQCLQKQTEVQWIPSHCMVLGNNETANKGTVSMWRLSSHSARLRIRNTKLIFQDTMPLTASKKEGKKVMSRNIIPAFPRDDAVASFRLSSAMSSSLFTESIHRSHVSCA